MLLMICVDSGYCLDTYRLDLPLFYVTYSTVKLVGISDAGSAGELTPPPKPSDRDGWVTYVTTESTMPTL